MSELLKFLVAKHRLHLNQECYRHHLEDIDLLLLTVKAHRLVKLIFCAHTKVVLNMID
jgi:hypothetical protein